MALSSTSFQLYQPRVYSTVMMLAYLFSRIDERNPSQPNFLSLRRLQSKAVDEANLSAPGAERGTTKRQFRHLDAFMEGFPHLSYAM